MQVLNIETRWDKVFRRSNKANHKKVAFPTRFGTILVADMYIPKNANEKLPALAVSGPFGAVKEQSSSLYAQKMTESGFLTIAFDPSFTGGGIGAPRYMTPPDINAEDFQAAVDFLSNNDLVDPGKTRIIGICGWGGLALNTVTIDTRIKATIASTMYDMTRLIASGYFDKEDKESAHNQARRAIDRQRTIGLREGQYKLAGGVVDPLPDDAPNFTKDYYAHYKTKRGYHKRSLNSNNDWAITSVLSLLNNKLLAYAGEIENAVVITHSTKVHPFYMGKDAFDRLKGDNKVFLPIEDATHTDLYDQIDKTSFKEMADFFNKYLNQERIVIGVD